MGDSVGGAEELKKVEDMHMDVDVEMVDEEALRRRKWEEGKKKGLFYAESSTGSDWTRVDPAWVLEDYGAATKQKNEEEGVGTEKRKERSLSRSRSSVGSDVDAGHIAQDGRLVHTASDGDGESDSWGALSPFHTRKTREIATRTTSVSTVPLLDNTEWPPDKAANGRERFQPTSSVHERQPSTSSATVTFHDDLDMAGIGARGSIASSGLRVGRARVARAASGSGGSGSWRGSKWSGEVGELMETRGREGEGVVWPTESEPELKL